MIMMMNTARGIFLGLLALLMLELVETAESRAEGPLEMEPAMAALVEKDWEAQEARKGRKPADAAAARDASLRAHQQLEALREALSAEERKSIGAELGALDGRLARTLGVEEEKGAAERLAVYRGYRMQSRRMMLLNPLFADRPLVFMKRRRFICQMLHEYLGYYYDYADRNGGGVYIMKRPGVSLEAVDLVAGRLPKGAYATPAVSFDAGTIYFAFAGLREEARPQPAFVDWTKLKPARAVEEPFNYFSEQGRSTFQVYAMDRDGSNLRRLSKGTHDSFNPCPLPDGDIAYLSTRRGGFCRCSGDFEPIPTYTLHRMDGGGGNVRCLSYHETNEWHPSLLADGRLIYTRWDYVDRSAAHFHGLWVCNTDGTNPRVLFGNYTKNISACYQPRSIPGSQRIMFVAGAHHAPVGGAVVILDPSRVELDPASGEDRFESLEQLTPEIGFPEAPGWPGSYYSSPWPLSEDYYLTAFSFGALPGWGSRVTEDTETGIYYADRFGNLELLYREEGIGCSDPIPLSQTAAPPELSSVIDEELGDGDEGELLLTNVNWSLMPLPENRPVKKLRVFQVLPKSTFQADDPPVGYAPQASARMFLGTVPVEADGSARFRAPARKPLYFQAVDEAGRAVAGMRSVTYLQPGERQSCVGCHEPPGAAPGSGLTLAARRGPSAIEPGPAGTRPMSFPLLVQPVLDQACVKCHDGSAGEGSKAMDLRGLLDGRYSRSYESLKKYVRWYTWIGPSIGDIVTRPGELGADASPLSAILDDEKHRGAVELSAEDRGRIFLWLDANAPFYGSYEPRDQEAQQLGAAIDPPPLQ